MSDIAPMKELYLGCECMSLDHVAQFIHFPPTKDGSKCVIDDEEEIAIYCAVKANNYFYRVLPPTIYFYDKYEWENFFYHSWFRRFWVAGRYIIDPYYRKKWGILNSFNFQDKDLSALDAFLSLISSDIDTNIIEGPQVWIESNDDQWLIKFQTDRYEFKTNDYIPPWEFGWEIHFKHRNFFGRIHYAFKYIFGQHNDEKHFSILGKDASKMRGIIKWIQDTNKKDKNHE